MYTKSHKNRDVDPPPLVPREVCHRRSRPREGRRRRRRWDASEHHSGGHLWDPLPRVGLPDPPSSRSLRASAAYRASRNRCCHWAWGPSPPLVRFRSVTVAQSWESATAGRPPWGGTATGRRDRRRSHARGN
jgi:hypothetical protein